MGKIFKEGVTFREGLMAIEEDGVVSEMITTSDTKQFFSTAVNEFFMEPNPDADMEWEKIFRVVPGKGHGELFPFRPPTVTDTVNGTSATAVTDEAAAGSHGIVFSEVGEGGEIKFSRVISAEKYVKHVKYATAIGYSNEWFNDGQMNLIEMTTEDFRDAAADKLAAIHYGAIVMAYNTGISSSTAASTGTAGSVQILNALNTAVTAMRRNKRKPGVFLIAPEQEQITRLALNMTVGGGAPGIVQNQDIKRLEIIVTEYLPSGTGYLIEPKRRLISTNRLPLSLGNFQDLLHDSEVMVGKFRRGVLIGEGQVIHAITSMPTNMAASTEY